MSLSTTDTYKQFSGNDSATVFAVTEFPILNASHLSVTHINSEEEETLLTEGTDYSVTLETSGLFSVSYPLSGDPLASGDSLLVKRTTPKTQELNLDKNQILPVEQIERALDKLTMQAQESARDVTTVAVGAVTTLDPGQPATVTNSGTQTDAVLAFGIPKGEQGEPGADGYSILSGSAIPSSGLGNDGDFYIRTGVWYIFGPKAAGAWPTPASLIGPSGAAGYSILSGSAAPYTGLGKNGDFYIRTEVWHIYGPKASSWGAPVSLIGPSGADGADGINGNSILSGSAIPSSGLGKNGDFYIRTGVWNIYGPKAAGAWPTPASLIAPSGTGTGDMLAETYDPDSINGDVFDTDNHKDGTTNKVFSAAEKTKLAGVETAADVTDLTNVASSVHGASSKATPVDNDEFFLVDSEASNVGKKTLWSSIKSVLKTYFDSFYISTRSYSWRVTDPNGSAITTGDEKDIFTVPEELNGWNLVRFNVSVTTVSSSGTPKFQLRNVTDSVDMLSTRGVIDASEYSTFTAATAPVIDTSHDDVATGDRLAADFDVAGTGTKGVTYHLKFQKP